MRRKGEGSIVERKRKNGSVAYLLKYEGSRGGSDERKIHYKTAAGTTLREAQRELRNLLKSMDDGVHVDHTRVTLADWGNTWLRDHVAPRVSNKTHERYAQLLNLHVKPKLGSAAIQKLTAPAVQKVYRELLETGWPVRPRKGKEAQPAPPPRGLSATTVRAVHVVLSACLRTAVKQRLIARNVCEDVTPPKTLRTTSEHADVKALNSEQLETLLKAFQNSDMFLLIAALAATGMRRGEALALCWEDVDLGAKSLRIHRSVEQTGTCGVQIKDRPKTKGSRRIITIDDGLVSLLRVEWKRQAETQLKLGRRVSRADLIFHPDPCDPEKPWAPDWISHKFARHAVSRGIRDVSLHSLRHTAATLWLLAGAPVHVVAARLGHHSPTVTLSVYAHVIARGEERVAEIAGGVLKGVLPHE